MKRKELTSSVEQLDPTWRAQNANVVQSRTEAASYAAVDVAQNLKRLASQRADGALAAEDAASRKRAAVDSTADMAGTVQQGPTSSMPTPAVGVPARPSDVQEQIRQLQNRYRG